MSEEMVKVTIEVTAQTGGWTSNYETRVQKSVSVECPIETMKQMKFEELCNGLAQIAIVEYENNLKDDTND